jgi:two-component system response regulator (stage 0 sporulation protein A)
MMPRWKVLLADDNKNFLDLLASRINAEEEFEVICTATDGEEALEWIAEYMPDVVVLDIIMPHLDGLAVQERLQELPFKPKVVIFSALGMDYVTRQALALGADAYFLKPFNLDVFIKRLRLLMGETREQQLFKNKKLSDEELDRRVAEMLHKLAVAPHLKGYRYLKRAITGVVNENGMLESITYKIYPSIAEMYDTTPMRVERAIRCTIENAWDRCRVDTIEQVFGYSFNEDKGKPSNSEFIAMIADKVLLEKNRNH